MAGPSPCRVARQGNGLFAPAFAACVTLAALCALPYAIPGLARLRVFTPLPPDQTLALAPRPVASAAPAAVVGETELPVETTEQAELRQPEQVELPAAAVHVLPRDATSKAPRPMEDPTGRAFDDFFGFLSAVERREPGAIARITYWGDSIVAGDFVTATLRRKLQKRFGDAGHGFMLMANAWPGYFHNDVVRFAAPGWQVSRVVGPFAKDGLYGLGGVSFRSEGPGVLSRFATTRSGAFGRAVSRFVLSYLQHPHGGTIAIDVDGARHLVLDSRRAQTSSALEVVPVPDGPHELQIAALSAGVRAFGVWMERDAPGVVLDAIGIQGCRIRFLDQTDDAHWAEVLAQRNPSLVVFQYGMNESEDGELYPLDQYDVTMRAVLEQVRRALPRTSCLLVGPMDRADKKGDGYISRPVLPKLVAIQRRIAGALGCAFFDTHAAMGGVGSMGIWVQRGLGGADLAHPSSAGAEVIGGWLYLALMEAYSAWTSAQQGRSPGGDRGP